MKFLYQPIKPCILTQRFGEDKACIALDPKASPQYVYKETVATCPVGYKSMYSQMKGHNGDDYNAYRWQPVYASQNGVVQEVCTEVERGLGVGVVTDEKYFCTETGKDEYFKYRDWHFIALDVHEGDHVNTGDLLGYADSTGYSTGDHVHFEIKPVEIWKDSTGKIITIRNVLQDNGYFGAVDPLPYMETLFALDIKGIKATIKSIREKLALIADSLADLLRKK